MVEDIIEILKNKTPGFVPKGRPAASTAPNTAPGDEAADDSDEVVALSGRRVKQTTSGLGSLTIVSDAITKSKGGRSITVSTIDKAAEKINKGRATLLKEYEKVLADAVPVSKEGLSFEEIWSMLQRNETCYAIITARPKTVTFFGRLFSRAQGIQIQNIFIEDRPMPEEYLTREDLSALDAGLVAAWIRLQHGEIKSNLQDLIKMNNLTEFAHAYILKQVAAMNLPFARLVGESGDEDDQIAASQSSTSKMSAKSLVVKDCIQTIWPEIGNQWQTKKRLFWDNLRLGKVLLALTYCFGKGVFVALVGAIGYKAM